MSSITMSQNASKAKNPEENREKLLSDLPSEIVINILSKLSVRTVATCKCICKLWLNLIKSPEFVKSHLSESKPGLVVTGLHEDNNGTVFRITEFEDSLGIDTIKLDCNLIIKLDFRDFIPNGYILVQCVANGFLFVKVLTESPLRHAYYICNPVTREYIELPNPIPEESVYDSSNVVAYGFGVSKWTGQYKLIRIFHGSRNETRRLPRISMFFCHVYTLGTGSWRSIKPVATLTYPKYGSGTFLNGILHWLVMDLNGCIWVSCFDLETEIFSTFSPPPNLFSGDIPDFWKLDLVGSGDYLYLCDDRRKLNENETVVWLMKEYGVDKSWTKAFVINRITDLDNVLYLKACPIKVYGHGGIVMVSVYGFFYYSNETKTATDIGMFGGLGNIPVLCWPNFLSLRSFPMENTKSF